MRCIVPRGQFRIWVCAAGVMAAAALRGSPPPPENDLPGDPSVTYGALSNGVRYAIRPRTGAAGRISFRLVVDAGSLNETDNQRGLAHLLEHMAFNGSEHFPAGTLVQFLQRQGMAIGPDANASTTFDRTTYSLELRHNDPAAVGQALEIFRDFSGGLLLPPQMIAKERGVVLSEKEARDSVDQRMQEAKMRFRLQGTLLPLRATIGDPAVIAQADREQLKKFYDAWYRPDCLTVVAVGDFEPAEMIAAIKAHFGRLRARGRAVPAPPFGQIANVPGVHVRYWADPELPGATVGLTVLKQGAAPPDSAQTRLQALPRHMAFLMFNRRLAEVASRPGAPFATAGAVCAEHLDRFQETAMALAANREGWQPALAAGEHELRRALQFGFQPAELRMATAVFAQHLEEMARAGPTRPASLLANELIDSLWARETWVAPADLLSLYSPVLSQISLETCNRAFREAWESPARFVTVASNQPAVADAEAAVAKAYAAAAREAVAADAHAEVPAWSYTDFGPASAPPVRHNAGVAELAEFPNGVRVNLKATRFQPNRIQIAVRVGTGLLEEPVGQPGLAVLTEQIFLAGGLKRYRPTELQQVLAGKTVSFNFSVVADAFQLRAVTNREDLLLQLQWIAATLTDSAFRPDAEAAVKAQIGGTYAQTSHTATGPLLAILPRLLASNDRRFGYPPLREVNRRSSSEVQAWLEPQLRAGPLEITLVGDFDPDSALEAIGRTLGALPARRRPRPLDAQRLVSFPTPPLRWTETVLTEIPTAAVAAYWPTEASTDEPRRDRLELLAAVLQDRVRATLRDQLGATYTPESFSYAPAAFPGYGYLRTQVTVDPAKVDTAAAVLAAIGASLASRSITPDETERARLPLAARAHDLARTDGYWLEALSAAHERPYTLEWARVRPADFDQVSPAELNELAAVIFRPSNLCEALVRPVKE